MKQDLDLPVDGLSDLLGADRQRKSTTRRAKNVGDVDPSDLSIGISQRGGQIKHTASALTPNVKVAHVFDIVYDNPTHTYANLDSVNCSVDWASSGANRSEALNIVHDDFGNHYYVDGAAAVVKVNASGRKVWNLPLPAKEKNSIVRALAVDVDGRVFAGVSGGVEPEKAQLWCFEQIEENKKPELLWEIAPGWLTEELHIDGATLQASQNNPTTRQSRMALYSGLGLSDPTLIREWNIPFPVNGHHFSPVDGSIFTAHQPDAQRTRDPRSPETSGSRQDWVPQNLASYADRAWAWCDGHDVDGGGLGNDDYAAGDVIESIIDKTGNGRDFIANAPDTGGVLRKGGIAGRDSIYFDGTANSYVSEAGVTTDFQFRGINRSFLPTYTKAQFALFLVLRLPQETGMRAILGNASTNEKAIIQNGGIAAAGPEALAGAVTYFEEAAGAGASGPNWGGSASQLGGCFDNSGMVLITVIHDGGYDDVAGTPTRSTVRINGRPCDRWTSSTVSAANTNPVGLGKILSGLAALTALARMRGDFCEAFVLSDWYTAGFGDTTVLTQQKLITTPTYPDAVWAADGDTELERLEGYFAHKWGMAHKLPTGQQNCLQETAAPAVNDTVTIGATVYTFKAAPATTAYEVRIGGTGRLSLVNLMHAINGSGAAGTDYGSATPINPDVFAAGVCHSSVVGGNGLLIVQRRDPRVFSTLVTTETSANLSWINGATTVSSANGGGTNTGAYPHSFYLFQTFGTTGTGTPLSRGGPPRSNAIGVTFPSVVGALISPYGMLAKWDPANGKARNVLTTNGPGYTFLPVGGVGYGVRVASDGSVFTIGPRQAAVSGIIASADNVDVRKLWDKGAEDTTAGGWATSNGATATTNWEAAPGAQTYAYPRMDVDYWDNVYVPLYQASSGSSLAVYAKLGATTGALNADPLLVLQSLTDDPRAYAASIDKDYPLYPHVYAKKRAERVLLGTERVTSASNFNTLHMVRIVSATLSNLPVRAQARLAVCGAGLYDFTTPATPAVVTGGSLAFNSDAPFISACEFQGKAIYTDGNVCRIYDPRTGELSVLRARSAGEVPKRFAFVERHVNRLFVGRLKDNPERIAASTAGDLYGWDFDPPGEAPLVTAAYRSDLTVTGDFPDLVNGMRSASNDLLYVFGARNVFLVRGDPLQGGRFDTVCKGVGGAFGRASCFTPDGRMFWVSTEAELWVMPIGGSEGSARLVSKDIAQRLQDAIDFSVCRPELVYDPRMRCIHIFLMPVGAGDTLFRHFRLSLDRMAFWEDSYGTTGVQPTSAYVIDGDAGEDRRLLLGSRDGYVREWSPTEPGDDGVRIDSECFIGPLHDQASGMEAMVSNVEVVLARAQGGARVELYATDESDDLGDAVASASLLPGRNTPNDLRQTGAYLGLLITGETGVERWSLRRVLADLKATGPVRSRGR